MALPQQLKSARMTDSTLAVDIDNEVGNLEKALADIFGIPINTDITTAIMSVSADGKILTLNEIQGLVTINRGTSSDDAILLGMAQPSVAGQRDSHKIVLRGTSFDSAGHNADWRTFIDVTSNAGASTLLVQTRLDAASFETVLALLNTGRVGMGTATPGARLGVVVPDTETVVLSTASAVAGGIVGLEFNYAGVTGGGTNNIARILAVVQTLGGGDLLFQTSPTGSSAYSTKMTLNQSGGFVLGSPTGGDKGLGTINATAVYDDNVLLTCYVFEHAYRGGIDLTRWGDPGTPQHLVAAQFEARAGVLDLDVFGRICEEEGRLPSLPSYAEWQSGGALSVGGLCQRLWETCELLAVHTLGLHQRLRAVEACLAESGT